LRQIARHVYGYRRTCESCDCSPDGTPKWQFQENGAVTQIQAISMVGLDSQADIENGRSSQSFVRSSDDPVLVQTYIESSSHSSQGPKPPCPVAIASAVESPPIYATVSTTMFR